MFSGPEVGINAHSMLSNCLFGRNMRSKYSSLKNGSAHIWFDTSCGVQITQVRRLVLKKRHANFQLTPSPKNMSMLKSVRIMPSKRKPIPIWAVPTTPWSVPSAPGGARRAAYEIAAEYVSAYVMPLSSSTGNTQTGFLMTEYRKNLTANVKNISENTFMWSTRSRMKPVTHVRAAMLGLYDNSNSRYLIYVYLLHYIHIYILYLKYSILYIVQ